MRAMNIIRIEAQVMLQWRVFRDGDAWVAVCDALKLTTFGDTWSDLTDSVNDILNHLLGDLLRKGELDRFLQENGWQYVGPRPVPIAKRVTFDVPWTPVRSSANDIQRELHPH